MKGYGESIHLRPRQSVISDYLGGFVVAEVSKQGLKHKIGTTQAQIVRRVHILQVRTNFFRAFHAAVTEQREQI